MARKKEAPQPKPVVRWDAVSEPREMGVRTIARSVHDRSPALRVQVMYGVDVKVPADLSALGETGSLLRLGVKATYESVYVNVPEGVDESAEHVRMHHILCLAQDYFFRRAWKQIEADGRVGETNEH